jgi:hypothetical protein
MAVLVTDPASLVVSRVTVGRQMKVKSVCASTFGQQVKLSLLPVVVAMAFNSCPSSADTLNPITLTGLATTRSCTDPNDLQCGSGNEDNTVSLPNSSVTKPLSSAQNTVNLGQVTSMSAGALATVPVGGSVINGELVALAGASATLDYQFEILGPQNILVPVSTLATLNISVSGTLGGFDSNRANAVFIVSQGGLITDGGHGIISQSLLLQNSVPRTESVGVNQSNMLATNTVYTVSMSVETTADIDTITDTAGLSASASIDPSFQLGPDAPSGYSIVFSDGIGDTSSATPLPATLPLFAGGLGFVGYLTRRKKRNAQATAA